MKWLFAVNNGGRDTGFHDAGVETFKGNIDRYLAREIIQNSLDARRDANKPVRVTFDVYKLKRDELPDIENLRATIERCREYWKTDKKAREFFERALKLAEASEIVVLKISDFNTTGVCGSDTDRTNNWYNLIKCAGSSSKGGGEGGSFGIGKNAPFAASQLRTVLYSTLNKDGENIFQGVAMLVSHNHPDGGVAQPVGYLGSDNGASVRNKKEIPSHFLRKQEGTDIVVLGFPASTEWQDDLVYSVLDNFWPAVHFGDLEVTVGNEIITKQSLPGLLEKFGSREDFTAHLYYEAFTSDASVVHPQKLLRLKDVTLYLLAGRPELPKRIAMVRRTGMKIFEKSFRSLVPFCGVFICRSEEGNQKLRDMEPPRHDVWDPNHPEKGVNKKIETEYLSFIRSSIGKLAPTDDVKVLSVPDLHRFLPDDDETPESSFDGESEQPEESINRRELPQKIEGSKLVASRKAMQKDSTNRGDEDDPTDAPGTGASTGSGDGSNDGTGGTGGGKRDESAESGTHAGATGGSGAKAAVPIRYRTYSRDVNAGVYVLTVKAEQASSARLLVWTVGDDQRSAAQVESARTADGKKLEVNGGAIGPLHLTPDSIKIELVLREPIRAAMEVTAHEA